MWYLIKNSINSIKKSKVQFSVMSLLIAVSLGCFTMLSLNNGNIGLGLDTMVQKAHDFITYDSDITYQDKSKSSLTPAEQAALDAKCGAKQDDSTKYESCYLGFAITKYNTDNPNNKVSYNFLEDTQLNSSLEDIKSFYVKNDNSNWANTSQFPLDGNIDKVYVTSGTLPTNDNQVLITPWYAKSNNLTIGSPIDVLEKQGINGGQPYIVSGTGYSPNALIQYGKGLANFTRDTFLYFTQNEYCKYLPEDDNFKVDPSYGCSTNTPGEYTKLFLKSLATRFNDSLVIKFQDGNNKISVDKFNEYMSKLFVYKNTDTSKPQQTQQLFFNRDDHIADPSFAIASVYSGFEQTETFLIIITLVLGSACLVIMLVTIKQLISENHKELGVMKAMGASRIKVTSAFLPIAFIPSLIGSILGFVIGFFVQMPINKLTLNTYQIPLETLYFSWNILLISLFVPTIFFTIVGFFFAFYQLRQGPIQLLGSNSKDKAGAIVSNTSSLLRKMNVKFYSRMKVSFLLKSGTKLVTIFLSLFFSSGLFTISLISNSSFDNYVIYQFQPKNYNYSYTIDQNLLWNNDDDHGKSQIIDDSYFAANPTKDITNSQQLLAAVGSSTGLSGYFISCDSKDNKTCWFSNDPLIGTFLNDYFPKKNDELNLNGKILFNLFLKNTNDTLGTKLFFTTTISDTNKNYKQNFEAKQFNLISVDNDTMSKYELWNDNKQNIASKVTGLTWSGQNEDIPIFISDANAKLNNIKIGDKFEANFQRMDDSTAPLNKYNFIVKGITSTIDENTIYTSDQVIKKLVDINFPKAQSANIPYKNWVISQDTSIFLENNISIVFDKSKFTTLPELQNTLQTPILSNDHNSINQSAIEDLILAKYYTIDSLGIYTTIFFILGIFAIVMALILIYISCNLTFNQNKKIIAIMYWLGYKEFSINNIFVGMYIPVVIIGAAIGIPVGLALVKVMIGVLTGGQIPVPVLIFAWQIVLVVLILSFMFLICYILSWLSTRKTEELPR